MPRSFKVCHKAALIATRRHLEGRLCHRGSDGVELVTSPACDIALEDFDGIGGGHAVRRDCAGGNEGWQFAATEPTLAASIADCSLLRIWVALE
jgi:hypothetical protein